MELWSRPVLREEEEEERRVDWIELFLDLAFVALVSNLASGLSRHIGLDGFVLPVGHRLGSLSHR